MNAVAKSNKMSVEREVLVFELMGMVGSFACYAGARARHGPDLAPEITIPRCQAQTFIRCAASCPLAPLWGMTQKKSRAPQGTRTFC